MSQDKNGMAKNIAVVAEELQDWVDRMQYNLGRDISLGFGKTNIFHVLLAFVSDTFKALPRTFTYLTLLYVLGLGIQWVFETMPTF